MKFVRYNEPTDPELFRISKVVPDRWLDERWSQRGCVGQGRWRQWRTSQFVRIHLLALVKAVGSFNRVSKELQHNTNFRRFCRLRGDDPVPSPGTLSSFRANFTSEDWREFHCMSLRAAAELVAPSAAGLIVLDATDLPAAVRRTSKKNIA